MVQSTDRLSQKTRTEAVSNPIHQTSRADSVWNRFWFGVGQAAEGIKNSALSSVLLFYYSQVLGLDAKLAGLALLLATVTDGISDIVVGRWSDTLHHQWGRRHPLMYGAVIPFSICFMLLFLPPKDMGQTALFSWLLAMALLARNAMTLFVIPHYALGAEMSRDYHARTVITAFRQFFSFVGTGLVFLAGVWFFTATSEYPNGQLNPNHYQPYGLTLGGIVFLALLTSTLFTHNAIPHLPQPKSDEHFSLAGSLRDIWQTCKLPSFAVLLSALFIWVIALFVFRAGEIYIATYFWRLDPELVFFLPLSTAVAFLFATPAWVWISRRIGKKLAVLSGLALGVVAYCLFVSTKIVGLLAPDQPYYEVAVFAISFAIAALLSSSLVIPGAMVADVTDEYYLATGNRREGILFAAVNFVAKVSSGVGAQISGLIVAYVGLMPKADPSNVSIAISNSLAANVTGWFLILGCASVALFMLYPLSQRRHEKILAELAARNSADKA